MAEVEINGIPVQFPFSPYDVQKDYMEKVIECLQKGQNGILESPTGTGKTLSLLCSSLGWLTMKKAQLQAQAQGGLYEVNGEYVVNIHRELADKVGVKDSELGAWGTPKIIYASRTHSQLSQAIQELKRTAYSHLKVAVLGSRDQMCIHPEVSQETNNANKVHMCHARVAARACYFYNNVEAKKTDKTFRDDGILDIEDMVKAGKNLRCCPYFMAREMKQQADIIFMPYNYLLDPKSRKAHGVELENNIIILDEAHNIEKMCEESASLQIRSTDIALCIDDVTKVMKDFMEGTGEGGISMDDNQMKDFTMDDLAILKTMFLEFEKVIDEIPVPQSPEGVTYPGSYIFDLLAKIELTHGKKNIVLEVLDKVTQYLTTTTHSSFMRRGVGLQKFSDLLKIVFSNDVRPLSHIDNIKQCYKVHVIAEEPKNKKQKSELFAAPKTSNQNLGRIVSYWCFSPGFGDVTELLQRLQEISDVELSQIFQTPSEKCQPTFYSEITIPRITNHEKTSRMQTILDHQVRSVILTSGTLSPLRPLISELGIQRPVTLENPHIIEPNQVWVGVVSHGPDGFPLNSSFNTRNDPKYISSLGQCVLNFSRIIPDGLLVFFPSYPIMKKCQEEWQLSGLWEKICKIKPIFVEPKTKEGFYNTMNEFYSKIDDSQFKGACFMSVCRGKVSEGLDFADRNGRGVIITGLPYPPFKDPRVMLKQKYLDEIKTKHKENLSGRDWYQLEASRAVNQAVGRVIRHRKDYGAIMLCDGRFGNRSFREQLSAWLKPHLKMYANFGHVLKDVKQFFRVAEELHPAPKGKSRSADAGNTNATPVGASFDFTLSRPKASSSGKRSTGDMEMESFSFAEYASPQTSSGSRTGSQELFSELEKPKVAINFNEVVPTPSSGAKQSATENVAKRRKLKLLPLRFDVESSNVDDVENFPLNRNKVQKIFKSGFSNVGAGTSASSTANVPKNSSEVSLGKTCDVNKQNTEGMANSCRPQKTDIVEYVKEVKRTLDDDTYKVFSILIRTYQKEGNFDHLVAILKEIFMGKSKCFCLFEGFRRFVKKEHKTEFDKCCEEISKS